MLRQLIGLSPGVVPCDAAPPRKPQRPLRSAPDLAQLFLRRMRNDYATWSRFAKSCVLAAQNRGIRSRWLKNQAQKSHPRKAAGRPRPEIREPASREPVRGFRFQNSRRLTAFTSRAEIPHSTSSENAGRSRAPFAAAPFPGRAIPHLQLGKFLAKLGRLLAPIEPSKKASGFASQMVKPSGDLLFFRALVRFHFCLRATHSASAFASGRFHHPSAPPFLRAP